MKKESYIRKRKTKKGISYQVSVPYDSADGRQWKTRSFNSWKYPSPADALYEAKQFRDTTLRDIQLGRIMSDMPTVEYFYNHKWTYFPKALSTREKHDTIFSQCFSDLRYKPLSDVTATDIQRTLTERAGTHTDDGVKRLLTVWRQIYRTALLENYPIVDLTASVELPKSRIVPKSRNVSITREQFSAFLSAILEYNSDNGEPRRMSLLIYNMLIIMYYCGFRPSEVLALSKSDIDLERKEISISKAVGCNYAQKRVIIPAKTTQSVRKTPIPDALLPQLSAIIEQTETDYLFLDQQGRFLDIDEVSDYIHRVSKSCGIPFNAYMLRHLYATDLVKTTDARTAQDLLGHASFSMTLDYARSSKDDREQAVKDRKLN